MSVKWRMPEDKDLKFTEELVDCFEATAEELGMKNCSIEMWDIYSTENEDNSHYYFKKGKLSSKYLILLAKYEASTSEKKCQGSIKIKIGAEKDADFSFLRSLINGVLYDYGRLIRRDYSEWKTQYKTFSYKEEENLQVIDFQKLLKLMKIEVNDFIKSESLNPKKKTGGFLLNADEEGIISDSVLVGTVDNEKESEETAIRKIDQLIKNPDHISSYLSRDPKNGLWGGAIRIPGYGIVAFSGLPELGDEACLLKSLLKMKLIDNDFVTRVTNISNNSYYDNY